MRPSPPVLALLAVAALATAYLSSPVSRVAGGGTEAGEEGWELVCFCPEDPELEARVDRMLAMDWRLRAALLRAGFRAVRRPERVLAFELRDAAGRGRAHFSGWPVGTALVDFLERVPAALRRSRELDEDPRRGEPEILLERAELLAGLGRLGKARELLRDAAAGPGFEADEAAAAARDERLARWALDEGAVAEARGILGAWPPQRATRLPRRTSRRLELTRAILAFAERDADRALLQIENLLAEERDGRDPEPDRLRFELGCVLDDRGRREEARIAFADARRLDPGGPLAARAARLAASPGETGHSH